MGEKKIIASINDCSGQIFEFKSLSSLIKFMSDEADFWRAKYELVNESSSQVHTFLGFHVNFRNALDEVESRKDEIETWDEKTKQNKLNQEVLRRHLQHSPNNWLWSGNAAVESYIKCHLKYGLTGADTFINLAIKGQINNQFNNREVFFGTMLAYEFLHQDSSIATRSVNERESLEGLKKQFISSKNELEDDVAKFKDDYKRWYDDAAEREDKLHRVSKRLVNRRSRQSDNKFDENLRTWSESIQELENTYEDKLRLEKPAKYWKDAAKRYGVQGSLWTVAIVALVVVGLLYFREFFLTWLQGKENDLKLNTIQGVILFGSIGAVYAYLLKILSRLAFSSFHLMRDAEEREQLTYLYLALSKENNDIQDSRELILQALFSRTETGLLAGEHGPTMPAGDILKAASSLAGKK